MTDLGAKMSSDEKEKINGLVAKLKESLKGGDNDKIKADVDELNRVLSEISTRIYQQAGTQQQQGGGQAGGDAGPAPGSEAGGGEPKGPQPGGGQGDNTVDAEYKVVDE